jgi:hypothetical protein
MRRPHFVLLLSIAVPASAQVDDLARRQTVIDVLSGPSRGTMADVARDRGAALRAIGFDAMPIASSLLGDTDLGTAAAYALLGADERRGLTMLFGSIPQSGPNVQRIAFTWFLDRYQALGPMNADARVAALKTLDPVRSTANAEAALYVLGLTGSAADIGVLEFHAVNFRTGSRGMRDASDAALLRLGSQQRLDRIRQELAQPLAATTTYQQGVALTLALQKAAFSGRSELVPAVCSHLNDRPLRGDVEFRLDPGRSARLALNAIVDGVSVTHLSAGTRTAEDWTAYCAERVAAP